MTTLDFSKRLSRDSSCRISVCSSSQVWVGQAGSVKAQRLKSILGIKALAPGLHGQNSLFVLSIFFDSDRRLQQVSIQGWKLNIVLLIESQCSEKDYSRFGNQMQ